MKITLYAILIVIVLTGLPQWSFSQNTVRARTEAGKEVILFPDGTWKYVDESKAPVSNSGYTKPSSAKTLFKPKRGNFGIWYDESKWKISQPGSTDTTRIQFNLLDGDGYALIVAEGIPIPTSALKKVALENAKNVAPDTKLITEETRVVNGHDVTVLKFKGTVNEIPLRYLGYYYGGKQGSIQFITFTAQGLFEKYEKVFIDFLNGLEVYE
jgi:hypothetical protein